MDPELKGPDPVWAAIKAGHGHIYYALALIVVLATLTPSVTSLFIVALAAGVFADCWAHEVLH